MHAFSAIAANTILRSIFGALIPLSGLKLQNKLGLGWGISLLAIIALVIAPIPVYICKHGKRLRRHSNL